MSRSLVTLRRNPSAKVRLLCAPHAGGAASAYRPWLPLLPKEIELCAIELPGRGSRLGEPLLRRIDSICSDAMAGVVPVLDKPFALFGHSLGGLIMFELARRLRIHGYRPGWLGVSGFTAPHLPQINPPIHRLEESEFLAELERLGGMPKEVLAHRELLDLALPCLRADCEAAEVYSYAADAPFDFPITALGGEEDPEVSHAALIAWKEHTSSRFTSRQFAGGHFFVETARKALVETIAKEVLSCVN